MHIITCHLAGKLLSFGYGMFLLHWLTAYVLITIGWQFELLNLNYAYLSCLHQLCLCLEMLLRKMFIGILWGQNIARS